MSLTTFLERSGYRRVPLSHNGVGHLEANGSLSGKTLRVLIDTGASDTIVSLTLAQELRLDMTQVKGTGGGLGAAKLDIFQLHADVELLVEGARVETNAIYAMDLGHVNAALAMKGSTLIEAILGVDVLKGQEGVIDYVSNSLFLKEQKESN